jgi:hypothetical protein
MAFSASEAAFEGFRIVRREPVTVLVWAVLELLFSLAIGLTALPMTRDLMAAEQAQTTAAANPWSILSAVGLLYLVLVPLYLLQVTLIGAAVYRTVLRPQEKGVARLKFGADELRLLGLWILMGLLFLVMGIVLLFLIGAAAGAVAAATHSVTAFNSATALGIFLILNLLFLLVFCWLAVRLSLAGPMTFAQRKIRLFGSWKLTKGRFWPLFGCYLLAIVFGLLISLVDVALVGAVNIGAAGGSLTAAANAMMRPDVSSYAAYFSVARILTSVIGAPFAAIHFAVLIAPGAMAYREIAGLSPSQQAEAFA